MSFARIRPYQKKLFFMGRVNFSNFYFIVTLSRRKPYKNPFESPRVHFAFNPTLSDFIPRLISTSKRIKSQSGCRWPKQTITCRGSHTRINHIFHSKSPQTCTVCTTRRRVLGSTATAGHVANSISTVCFFPRLQRYFSAWRSIKISILFTRSKIDITFRCPNDYDNNIHIHFNATYLYDCRDVK